MKIKTSELAGTALDWAVAKCEVTARGVHIGYLEAATFNMNRDAFSYSTNWLKGGPIIEREWICVDHLMNGQWLACKRTNEGDAMLFQSTGSTYLTAGMRCYVASKMGDEVNVPEELTK